MVLRTHRSSTVIQGAICSRFDEVWGLIFFRDLVYRSFKFVDCRFHIYICVCVCVYIYIYVFYGGLDIQVFGVGLKKKFGFKGKL